MGVWQSELGHSVVAAPARGNVSEGGNQAEGECRGEVESGGRSQRGTAALVAAAAQWDEGVQKVLECLVPASWGQREPWWPGGTLPGSGPSQRTVPIASKATTA